MFQLRSKHGDMSKGLFIAEFLHLAEASDALQPSRCTSVLAFPDQQDLRLIHTGILIAEGMCRGCVSESLSCCSTRGKGCNGNQKGV